MSLKYVIYISGMAGREDTPDIIHRRDTNKDIVEKRVSQGLCDELDKAETEKRLEKSTLRRLNDTVCRMTQIIEDTNELDKRFIKKWFPFLGFFLFFTSCLYIYWYFYA